MVMWPVRGDKRTGPAPGGRKLSQPFGVREAPKGLSCFQGTLPELLDQEMVSATSVCPISAFKISLANY